MKNIYSIFAVCFTSIVLTGCSLKESGNQQSSSENEQDSKILCTFNNYDGTKLFECYSTKGTCVEYLGPVPTKPSDWYGGEEITYTFIGWDKSLENVQYSTVFTAQFKAKDFTCTFKNFDGSVLFTTTVEKGNNVSYDGPIPTKSDENNSGYITKFSFCGWDKSLENIQSSTVFIAQYTTASYIECKFINYDGSLLSTTLTVPGGSVEYEGKTPKKPQETKDGTNITEFTFENWDKPLFNILVPTTFTAIYSSKTYTGYLVTFNDKFGNELYSYYCEEGTTAIYPLDTPFYYDDINVELFVRWDKILTNVREPIETNAIMHTISRKQNGEYPNSLVTDSELINALDSISTIDSQGYKTLNGEKYYKIGTPVLINDYEYIENYNYFKVEPIKWRFLSAIGSYTFVTTEYTIDCQHYNSFYSGKNDQGYYANNYKNSRIRNWLNSDFLNNAFYSDNSLIRTTEVNNSLASTGDDSNDYVCEATDDRVFLLSVSELNQLSYGFSSPLDKISKLTDFAIARGAYIFDKENNAGSYWTRSPSKIYSHYVYTCSSCGSIDITAVDNGSGGSNVGIGVRPGLVFNLKD